ncbi:hypothetical protein Hdeb2414_s0301g00861111 [Helianthus debilis subsp. tardiflorus]
MDQKRESYARFRKTELCWEYAATAANILIILGGGATRRRRLWAVARRHRLMNLENFIFY